jgi:hypothetical protein
MGFENVQKEYENDVSYGHYYFVGASSQGNSTIIIFHGLFAQDVGHSTLLFWKTSLENL